MIIGNKNITSLNDKGDNYFLRGLFLSQSLSLKKQMYLRIIEVQILFKFHKIFCQYRNLAFTQAFFPHQEYLALPYLTFPHNSHPLRVNLFCTLCYDSHLLPPVRCFITFEIPKRSLQPISLYILFNQVGIFCSDHALRFFSSVCRLSTEYIEKNLVY